MELSTLQKRILDTRADRSVVISAASSGKTRLLTEKVRQLLRDGVNPRTIAVITFTNMAATELRQRLGSDYKEGLYVGTIHALANYMLCKHGYDTSSALDSEEFDKLFDMIVAHPNAVEHYNWVLLDEAQDSDKSQFHFLFDMIAPECFFVTGDPKQSIYSFRGSDSRLMSQLAEQYNAQIFDMNENYRNGAKILMYAKRLIKPTGLIDTSVAMREDKGEVIETLYTLGSIVDIVKSKGRYGDWAVLTRTNKEISKIISALYKNGIPYDTFKQGDISKDELTQKMERNSIKVLTVHSAKGLEWDNVVVCGMKYYNNEERNICYVAATRARKLLVWMGYAPRK